MSTLPWLRPWFTQRSALQQRTKAVITDSGGIQDETFFLGSTLPDRKGKYGAAGYRYYRYKCLGGTEYGAAQGGSESNSVGMVKQVAHCYCSRNVFGNKMTLKIPEIRYHFLKMR